MFDGFSGSASDANDPPHSSPSATPVGKPPPGTKHKMNHSTNPTPANFSGTPSNATTESAGAKRGRSGEMKTVGRGAKRLLRANVDGESGSSDDDDEERPKQLQRNSSGGASTM